MNTLVKQLGCQSYLVWNHIIGIRLHGSNYTGFLNTIWVYDKSIGEIE